MASSPQFNLRWNNHSCNILQVFSEQLSSESLVDVTLSCQGQFIKAHKMVLSACSPYFQDLFIVHQTQHPVIILNGVRFNDLKMVVDFMYRGETRVVESELSGLLAIAEALQVKGLSNVRNKYEKGQIQGIGEQGLCPEPVEEEYLSNFYPDSGALDPLALPSNPSEPAKPTRKRKRVSEARENLAKAPPPKVGATGPVAVNASVSGPSSLKKTAFKISNDKESPKESTGKELNREKPTSVEPSTKESRIEQCGKKKSSSKKSPSRDSNQRDPPGESSCKKTNVTKSLEVEELSAAMPPLVPVATKNAGEDNDLAETIRVEPLFIRDIDDNDASWDDPARLVIDLPSDEIEGKKDESKDEGKQTSDGKSMSTTFIPKQKLKLRPTSELIAPTQSCDRAETSSGDADKGTSNATKENSITVLYNERRGKGGKIPRPPNAFMIFANEWRRKLALEHPTESNKQISVRLGVKWKSMTAEKKEIYFTASKRADEEHKRKYPDYFYSPKEARLRKSQMQALRQAMRTKLNKETEVEATDPLKVVKTYMKESDDYGTGIYIASIDGGTLTVKEELLDDESTPQNLEEEFLKMVEDGHVEAEIEDDNGEVNCENNASGSKV